MSRDRLPQRWGFGAESGLFRTTRALQMSRGWVEGVVVPRQPPQGGGDVTGYVAADGAFKDSSAPAL